MLVGRKLGPFSIDKELGTGAMGSVYRAKNDESGQIVALKLISAALASNEQALARFQREVSILKQLDHPNITKYFGSGRFHKVPFYIMEFVEGEALDRILERRGRITWEEVIAIGTQLCAALQHAHEKGIIHRDLKPANLMILEDGTCKLTDFGIAKDTDVTALTAAHSTLGTASYMSPEQCKGVSDLTAKSDLYSMGIMFYELLTGRKPFNAETVMDMFLMHTQSPFERPSRWVLEIPIWFDTLICELLEKEPQRRPESAQAVAKSLSQIKEKMLTQSSAGLDAASKRRVDRSAHDLKLSQGDKELARTLLGKKKKTKSEPFYRKNWFTVTAVAAVATLLGLAIWFLFIKAPSADSLYAQAEQLLQSAASNPKDYKKASDGPIDEFLRYYGDHPKAKDVLRLRDKAEAEWCDYQLKNRHRLGLLPESEQEQVAFDALDAENEGKLVAARSRWSELAKLKSEATWAKREWGLVAEKYLAELKSIDELSRAVTTKVNKELAFEEKYEGDTKEEKLALNAMRDEVNDRKAQARATWEELRDATKNQPEMRRWHLLAAHKVRDLAK